VIVILEDGGLRGLGEAPVVPGRGPSLETLLAELRDGTPRSPAACCAVETARCDLEARRLGMPMADLLGGRRRSGVECSALVTEARPERVAREVEARSASGFSTFKLKAGQAASLDQERLGAARWAAGPRARFRVDFNGRLDPGAAGARLASLGCFGVELFEQPLGPEAGVRDWLRLAAAAPAPLAADESLADLGLGAALAGAGLGLALKVATVGGPRAALRLAGGARGPVTIGSSLESSIGVAAALHVACALPAEPLPCGLATASLLGGDLTCGLVLRGSRLELPAEPGLGVVLDERALDAYRLDR
jgi:L-alanine-DL-glutamate epimerase-like enolase superfamily enzyme